MLDQCLCTVIALDIKRKHFCFFKSMGPVGEVAIPPPPSPTPGARLTDPTVTRWLSTSGLAVPGDGHTNTG